MIEPIELPPGRSDPATDYSGYKYSDRNNQFLVQNVVKKPGCETFQIDFGNSGGVVGKKPELSKKIIPSKKLTVQRLPNSARISSRRPLKKLEKDERNLAVQAIRRISTENYRNRPHSVGRLVDRRSWRRPSQCPGSSRRPVLVLR